MRKSIFTNLLIVLLALIMSTAAFAQIPKHLSYQGYASDISGNALTGTHILTVNLFNLTGDVLWTEDFPATSFENGVFSVILGETSSNPLPDFNIPMMISVKIDNGAELLPRIKVTASAYSLMAKDVLDNAITDPKIAINTVVRSLNGLTDYVNIIAGDNITLTPNSADKTLQISATAAEFEGLLNAHDLVITNESLNPTFRVNHEDGSLLSGPAVFTGSIRVPFGELGSAEINSTDGFIIHDPATGAIALSIHPDGISTFKALSTFEGGLNVPQYDGGLLTIDNSGLFIKNETGETLLSAQFNGTSLFNNLATFNKDVEISLGAGRKVSFTNEDGKVKFYDLLNNARISICPENGLLMKNEAGTEVLNLNLNGPSLFANLVNLNSGINIPFIGGHISINPTDGFVITNVDNTVLTQFAIDGSSFHSGLEKYKNDIVISDNDIEGIRLSADGHIFVYDNLGGAAMEVSPEGTITVSDKLYTRNGLEIARESAGITFPDGTFQNTAAGSFNGILRNVPLLVYDDGNTVKHALNADGTSFHYGLATFEYGLTIPTTGSGEIRLNKDDGFKIIRGDGTVGAEFNPEGTFELHANQRLNGDLWVSEDGVKGISIEKNGTLTVYNELGSPTATIFSDGSSFSHGMATFYGSLDLAGESVIRFVDGSIQTTAWQPFNGNLSNLSLRIFNAADISVIDLNTDGTSQFAGNARFEAGLTIAGEGNGITFPDGTFLNTVGSVNFNGVLNNIPLVIKNEAGDTTVLLKPDGSVKHAGLTIAGEGNGITFPDGTFLNTVGSVNFNGVLNNIPLVIKNDAGDVAIQLNPDGTSIHTGLERFNAGIVIPGVDEGVKLTLDPSGLTFVNSYNDVVANITNYGMATFFEGMQIPSDNDTYIQFFPGGMIFPFENGGRFNFTTSGLELINPAGYQQIYFSMDGTTFFESLTAFNSGIIIPKSDGSRIELYGAADALLITATDGSTAHAINTDGSSYQKGLAEFDNGIHLLNSHIQFPDGSLQTTAGIPKQLPSGKILIGNDLNVAAPVTVSGDVAIDFTGATTIANNAVTTPKIHPGANNSLLVTNNAGEVAWTNQLPGRTKLSTCTAATPAQLAASATSVIYYRGTTVIGYANLPTGTDGDLIYVIFETGQTTTFGGRVVANGGTLSFVYHSGEWHLL